METRKSVVDFYWQIMNCRIQRLLIRWKLLNEYFSYIALHWCTTVFILVTAPFYLLICHVDTRVIFEKRFYKIWWWRKIAAKFNNLYFVFRNIHLFTFLYANKISSFRGLAQNIKCISMIGSPCTESWNSFSWKIHKLGGNEFNLL